MKEMVTFEKEEFNKLLIKFAENMIENQKKGYGVTVISNETQEPILNTESMIGSLLLPWNNTFTLKGAINEKI